MLLFPIKLTGLFLATFLLTSCNSATTSGNRSSNQQASLTPAEQERMVENCQKYAGEYTLNMAEWHPATVSISCQGGRPILDDVKLIGGHTYNSGNVTLIDNQIRFNMQIDNRYVGATLSGEPENMTGSSDFHYRGGSGSGGGNASMRKIG